MTTISLGITGGIGSGKSTVARLLALMGVPVYNCDVEARRLMTSDEVVRRQLIALLGPQVYTGDGALNKSLLASYLFASPAHARQVNAIVHPRVRADYRLWAASAAAGAPASGARWIGMESAILLEAGFRGEVDRLVVVTAPLELRIARAMERDGADRGAVEQRIRAQISDEERCRQADYVIVNDGICGLIPQVRRMLSLSPVNNLNQSRQGG